uniref:Uncharacterized protein n=1 Tax=Rhizophora mucronata TaxID=61149 RepID=A0A2P2Q9V1_RHIMU
MLGISFLGIPSNVFPCRQLDFFNLGHVCIELFLFYHAKRLVPSIN